MSGVEISRITDKNYGSCVKLSNGIVELLVTVDFGPRIIYFSRTGMKNVLYQDLSMSCLGEPYDVYEGDQMKLYGGHRIWISPEIVPRCYYPDNNPVSVEIEGNRAVFTAPVEKINNIQKILDITLVEGEPVVSLSHVIKNCGMWDIELAPWCLTIMAAGGTEVVPMPDRKTGYLMNRTINLWDYSEMTDSRVYWGKKYITLTQDASKSNPFKFGINNEDGWAAYFNKEQVFLKFFEPDLEALYPDNGSCYETYANGLMLEMETLGEYVQLAPGDSCEHAEMWELYESHDKVGRDEAEIEKIIKKYM